ncbi:hypothetical protein BT69DRAFT_1295672 [Atractiella rhizophila]|nr:hypothetical protein BT69DRAFT_1295672 [Atractiella rhizophila]
MAKIEMIGFNDPTNSHELYWQIAVPISSKSEDEPDKFINATEKMQALVQDFDFAIKEQEGRVNNQERTKIDGEDSHRLLDDFESIYHVLYILTFAHITEAEIRGLGLKIEGYLSKTSPDSKRRILMGNLRVSEKRRFWDPVFGPIIIIFRLFLSPGYVDDPKPL